MNNIIKKKRVVVTGLSAISPIGSNVEQNWTNLLNSVSGIVSIESHPELKGLKS